MAFTNSLEGGGGGIPTSICLSPSFFGTPDTMSEGVCRNQLLKYIMVQDR